ncbi:PLP-dependent transferase [bacterium]|nr:PLP-dependent transferase [bacterium]
MKNKKENYSMETKLIHGEFKTLKWDYSHHVVPPISSSATFRLDSSQRGAKGFIDFAHVEDKTIPPIYIYDRLGEPNKDILEENLAFAEHGEIAVTFSTGMGAISAILGILLKSGDSMICHRTVYGCTFSLLNRWYPRYNIACEFSDLTKAEILLEKIVETTKVIYFETPVNPNLEIIDIEKVCKIVADFNAKRSPENKIYVVIDNTFATPIGQRPLNFGADFVIHSLTKNIGGFGTDMGGVVIGKKEFHEPLLMYRKDFGAPLHTKSAWTILVHGLPTLASRLQQQQFTAKIVAEFLENHSKVEQVFYPGLASFPYFKLAKKQMVDHDGNFVPGTMIYFTLKEKDATKRQELGIKFINEVAQNSYAITLAVSLGNIRTLIEHPSSMTHSSIPPEKQIADGIDPGGIRLSIGLEKSSDLLSDLASAFEKI